ncbi:MAG: ABC transporter ATP-binding protein [Sarcina sp.]
MDKENVLEVKNLVKYFPHEKSFFGKTKTFVKAVDNVSFSLKKGESLAVVGESGCGKTTLAKTLLKLYEKNSGDVFIEGKEIFSLKKEELNKVRKKIQMIFQDPFSSLDPSKTAGEIIGEAMIYHGIVKKENLREEIIKVMKSCGLTEEYIDRYPDEFSGGQRQRIGIARAIALNPEIIIADEPVSALDVSTQAQIVNLLLDLQEEKNLSYIFISHDLSLVKYIADKVMVMYLGNIVEIGDKDSIYRNPKHPYTKALMDSVPVTSPRDRRIREVLMGEVPSPINPPKGCKFHNRCKYAMEQCKSIEPKLEQVEGTHLVACYLFK